MDQKPKGWRSIPSPFSCLLPPLPERIQVLSWGVYAESCGFVHFSGMGTVGGHDSLSVGTTWRV